MIISISVESVAPFWFSSASVKCFWNLEERSWVDIFFDSLLGSN